mgnify:FL=1|tara:strand:+ start:177 stop:419 length:243 start_codon:yes stop_codon:yes gene_type:complete
MRYVLFVKDSCPFCIKAQDLLTEKQEKFKTVNFEDDQSDILKEMKDACSWPTVPMIFEVKKDFDIKFIGGYSDLLEHLGD